MYQSLPIKKPKKTPPSRLSALHDGNTRSPLDGITFSFSQQLSSVRASNASLSSYATASEGSELKPASDCSRESDNSLYQLPCAPRAFMDHSGHSEDLQYLSAGREPDQISLSSTASSSTGYPRRPDSGGAPLYVPMNKGGGHSPGSSSKVSVSFPNRLLELTSVPYIYQKLHFLMV